MLGFDSDDIKKGMAPGNDILNHRPNIVCKKLSMPGAFYLLKQSVMEDIPKAPDHFRTFTGITFDFTRVTVDMIDIRDIAHALSNQCRFGGHTYEFYSVAQHCVNVARTLPDEHKLAGLLHDAAEAYMVDLPRPIKSRMPEYHRMEEQILRLISRRFKFLYPFHPLIKKADDDMLLAEWNGLMVMRTGEPTMYCLSPEQAKQQFLEFFYKHGNR